MTGKWNESLRYQPCDAEGEPLPNTELKEVFFLYNIFRVTFRIICDQSLLTSIQTIGILLFS